MATSVKPATPKGESTRKKLIAAAIAVIGEQGMLEARVEEIARRAGYAYGTFYKYFASKPDLMRQVMTEVYDELHRDTFLWEPETSDPHELIRSAIKRHVDAMWRHRAILAAFDHAIGLDPSLLELRDALLRRDVDQLAQTVVSLQDAGREVLGPARLVSLALNCLTDEMSRRWRAEPRAMTRAAFVGILESIFEHVLLNAPPAHERAASRKLRRGKPPA